jgi:four helix bundle protein
MPTNADGLRERSRRFAVRILKFVKTLSADPAGQTVAGQLGKAGTSVSANYHAAGRGRSRAEFIAKLGIVVEEADECQRWLEIARDAGLSSGEELEWLLSEASQLRAIFSAALKTARRNHYGKD